MTVSVLVSRRMCTQGIEGPGLPICLPHTYQFSRSDVTRRAAVVPLIELKRTPCSNQTCRDAVLRS